MRWNSSKSVDNILDILCIKPLFHAYALCPWTKNVPWHILAPVAVACDIYLLRLSAYPRGAFFWFTGNYFPVNQKKFLLRETFFIFTIASPASGYSIPPETIPCTSEYIRLSDQIRFYVLYGTGIWPVSSFHAKMRLYLYSVVIWNPQIETKK